MVADAVADESVVVMIDNRLLDRWQRERAAREEVRAALPESWRNPSHPKLYEVRETYVEAMVEVKRSPRVVAITNDDR
jgi:tryptophan 2,3-dioxygenase